MDQPAAGAPAARDGEHDLDRRPQALHESVEDAENRLSRDTWGYLVGGPRRRPRSPATGSRWTWLPSGHGSCATAFPGHALALPVALAPGQGGASVIIRK